MVPTGFILGFLLGVEEWRILEKWPSEIINEAWFSRVGSYGTHTGGRRRAVAQSNTFPPSGIMNVGWVSRVGFLWVGGIPPTPRRANGPKDTRAPTDTRAPGPGDARTPTGPLGVHGALVQPQSLGPPRTCADLGAPRTAGVHLPTRGTGPRGARSPPLGHPTAAVTPAGFTPAGSPTRWRTPAPGKTPPFFCGPPFCKAPIRVLFF